MGPVIACCSIRIHINMRSIALLDSGYLLILSCRAIRLRTAPHHGEAARARSLVRNGQQQPWNRDLSASQYIRTSAKVGKSLSRGNRRNRTHHRGRPTAKHSARLERLHVLVRPHYSNFVGYVTDLSQVECEYGCSDRQHRHGRAQHGPGLLVELRDHRRHQRFCLHDTSLDGVLWPDRSAHDKLFVRPPLQSRVSHIYTDMEITVATLSDIGAISLLLSSP